MIPSKKPKILLVDDNMINLKFLEYALKRINYELVSVLSAKKALEVLNEDYNLCLLDVEMPEMDGLELAQHIRNDKKLRDIPLIFVTGISLTKDFIFRAKQLGIVDVIPKPVDLNKLLFLVDSITKKSVCEK